MSGRRFLASERVARVCAILQLRPPTYELKRGRATRLAAFFCSFNRARTFCLYAFTNANAGAPDELLIRVVVDAAGFVELLPRDGAEADACGAAACEAEALLPRNGAEVAILDEDAADDAARVAGTLLPRDGAEALAGALFWGVTLRFATGALPLVDAPRRFTPTPRDDAEATRALRAAYLTTASRILGCRGFTFRHI